MPDKLARRQESQAVIIWYCKVNYTLDPAPEEGKLSERRDVAEMCAVYEAPQSRRGKVFESQFNPGRQWKFEVCVSAEMK